MKLIEKDIELLITKEELLSLQKELRLIYGYDFKNYATASLKRRVSRFMRYSKIISFLELKYRLGTEEEFFNYFLEEVTVNVTEMFRDPSFFRAIREQVIPQLKTYPNIRIWHAGCSTGEEVYSMAILLEEEGLLERSLLYATDINQHVLEQAKSMKFNIDLMSDYASNYLAAGGKEEFSKYYTAQYGKAVFNDRLKQRMVFSTHNLVNDQSFNEFNLVICRNVLIYFNRELQDNVIGLFTNSVSPLGFLALGSKESLSFSKHEEHYNKIDGKMKIWQKKR
ncbi:MAG: chemotaxis protein methyltransferase CheR [Crocinitomix sp.]|jgi:chemotaxis protein methyltransferase CheR